MALISCGECGKQISDKATACPGCGAPIAGRQNVAAAPLVVARKSRSTAILLALFLGGLGIHRFYLNQPGFGVVCLLFFWTFIPAVIGVIDAIYFLCMSDEKFDSEFNRQFCSRCTSRVEGGASACGNCGVTFIAQGA